MTSVSFNELGLFTTSETIPHIPINIWSCKCKSNRPMLVLTHNGKDRFSNGLAQALALSSDSWQCFYSCTFIKNWIYSDSRFTLCHSSCTGTGYTIWQHVAYNIKKTELCIYITNHKFRLLLLIDSLKRLKYKKKSFSYLLRRNAGSHGELNYFSTNHHKSISL